LVTFDEAAEMLDEIAEELPEEFFESLNGGVSLLPHVKRSAAGGKRRKLYILGEYIRCPAMGRYINIYYGSFERVYGGIPHELMKKELKATLIHEFTHHVEELAGERWLEIKDSIKMDGYLDG
jgi:hypothetical protein